MTAQFSKRGKTFHFMINGSGWLDSWISYDTSFSVTVTREELTDTRDCYITPIADPGWYLSGDYWDANGTPFVSEGQYGELYLTPAFYDKYPDNTTFSYTLIPSSTTEYTITVKATRWLGSGWNQDVQGSKVGFNKSDLSAWDKTIKVPANEKLTVYAEGADGFHSYPNDTDHWYYRVAGLYDSNHVAYKTSASNTGIDSYTFTVNSDRTIYVDFQYVSQ